MLALILTSTGCEPEGSQPIAQNGIGGSLGPSAPVPGPIEGPPLVRGINFGSALDAPVEGEWAPPLTQTHFALAKASGFDHVRLPARFSAHTGPAPEYLIDQEFLMRVDWALAQAEESGLSLIVDLHHFEELHLNPAGERARFLAMWRQIAERYENAPGTVYFEPLNEPSQQLDPEWNQLFAEVLEVIRETNPERWVIADGPHWADPDKLSGLVLPADPRVVASFHFYKPLPFTVQGAPWMDAEYQTTGVLFPGPPSEPLVPKPEAEMTAWVAQFFDDYNARPGDKNPCSDASVRAYFDDVRLFSLREKVPLYLGEFAVVDFASPASRAAWLRSVVKIAEEYGIPWTYWDDAGHNRGMIVEDQAWVPEVHEGLFGPSSE